MKKISILLIICLFFQANIYSQKISRSKANALNSYIDYTNFLVKQMDNGAVKLLEYYNKTKSFKNRRDKTTKTFYFSKIIAGKDDIEIYNKAINNSKKLNPADAQKLNSSLAELHDIYKHSRKLMQELEIYHKLNDYQIDNFKRCDEIIDETQNVFFDFNTKYWRFHEELNGVYRKYQPYNEQNTYLQSEMIMKTAMQEERELFKNWYFNFEKKTQTGMFDTEKVVGNINTVDIKYRNNIAPNSYKHPLNFYYNRFFSVLTATMQKTKRNGIDGYTIETKISDQHSNEYYKYLYQYYNSLLVSECDGFVYSLNQKGTYLLKGVKMPFLFVVDSNNVDIITDYKKFEETEILKFEITSKSKNITHNQVTALNNYINYINRETKIVIYRAEKMRYYNKTLDKYYGTDLSAFETRSASAFTVYEDYRIARSLYEQAINDSRYLPTEYSKSLNMQLEAINQICSERRYTIYSINKYAKEKTFLTDNFTEAYKLLTRFGYLWNEYDLRKELIYNDIKKIYDSYPNRNPENTWYKSAASLEKIIDENYMVLTNAKKNYTDSTGWTANLTNLNQNVRNTLTNKYENIEKLDRFGRNHGYCPYTIYDDIPTDSKDFSLYYLKLKEKDTLIIDNYYDNLLRHYNDIISDYNKFVWLAEGEYEEFSYHEVDTFFLLKKPLQPDIFIMQKPVKLIEPDTIFTSMEGFAFNNLTLLLDVSQSMSNADKLPLLQESFLRLLTILRPEDFVSIVVYSGSSEVVLKSISCAEKEIITEKIENLSSSGSTKINFGLKKALEEASDNYIDGGNNKIILATDGVFNSDKKTEKLAKKIAKKNIDFTIFLFGSKNIDSDNLKELIKNTNGKIEIINSENMNLKLINEVQKK